MHCQREVTGRQHFLGARTMKPVIIGVGTFVLVAALMPLVIAIIPYLVGLAGVAVLWFTRQDTKQRGTDLPTQIATLHEKNLERRTSSNSG